MRRTWMERALLLALWLPGAVWAQDSPWQAVERPAAGAPLSIGDYSAGCVQGAQPLPLDGEGYQVMHPSRRRYYGHPDLVQFLQALGRAVKAGGLEVMLVGDMSLPRGGRASGGHASHQTGLDVDIWLWRPEAAGRRPLSAEEREQLKSRSALDAKSASLKAKWAEYVVQLVRLAAEQPRVERIFVHPVIKRELCARRFESRDWLGKVRPWYGHDDHLHARLACPASDAECTRQAPVPEGDGCAELDWWFSEEARADREKGRQRYWSKVSTEPKLPPRCLEVLHAAP